MEIKLYLNENTEHVLNQIVNNILNARELYYDIEKRTDGLYPVFSKILEIIRTEIQTTEHLRAGTFNLLYIWWIREEIMKLTGFRSNGKEQTIKNLVESAFTMVNLMVDHFKV